MSQASPSRQGNRSNLHSAWARLFARALAASGVDEVVVSPGSRSTPLALAFANETMLHVTVVIDERSAGFFALGQARLSGKPTVLLCTSGTAGAHYLPAIIESNQAHIPLLAVTADRPWELQDSGAPQTIDQTKMFGDFVRHAAELGLPDVSALSAVGRIAAQCVAATQYPTPGPVHVNARFRKPLEPVPLGEPEDWQDEYERWLERGAPRVSLPTPSCGLDAIERLVLACRSYERGLLVVGPTQNARFHNVALAERFRRALARLATLSGFPIFAEAPSQARFGDEIRSLAAPGLDAALRAGAFRGHAKPDVLVEIFSPPTSSGYASLAADLVPRLLITEHGFPDPHGTATDVLVGDPLAMLERAADSLGAARLGRTTTWLDSTVETSRQVERCAEAASADGLTEAAIAREIVAALPDGAVLSVGNSLPVRDLEAFGGHSSRAFTVLHQRGASGIDGLIAGAAGARSVHSKRAPVVLVLGDVSAQHDLGSIAALVRVDAPLVVVVVQNGGGRIFEELPIAGEPTLARELSNLFVTPPVPRSSESIGLVESVCAGFGVSFFAARDRSSFVEALASASNEPRATVIEAVVVPEDGKARRRAFLASVRGVLEERKIA